MRSWDCLFFFLSLQVINTLFSQRILQHESKNFHPKNDDQPSPCNIITDCFNCTMFNVGNTNCAWEDNQCVTTYDVK